MIDQQPKWKNMIGWMPDRMQSCHHAAMLNKTLTKFIFLTDLQELSFKGGSHANMPKL
jgi:hypothetical protein